jgi:hypothetical protein
MGSTVLSRRAAVRGAVWSIPAVTVATTAPAFANTSGGMALTGFTAAYVAPDRLVISGTVVAGSVANAGTLTFTIEPHLYGSVDVVSGAPGTVVPTPGGGFTITYAVTAGSFSSTLDLGADDLAGLFRGYRAEDTTLMADVEPSVSDPQPVPVAAFGSQPALDPVIANASWLTPTTLRMSASGLRLTDDADTAVGRLRVAVLFDAATPASPSRPVVSNLAPGWQLDPRLGPNPLLYGGGWLMRFVTTQGAHTSLTGTPSHRGPGAFGFDLDVTGSGTYPAQPVQLTVTSDETAFGWPEDSRKIADQTPRADLPAQPPGPPATPEG